MRVRGTELVIRRRTFLIGGAAAVGGAAAFTGKCLASVDGDSGPRLFGLSIPGSSPSSVQEAQAAGASLGRAPQVINFYMAWECEEPFPTATVAAIRDAGAVPQITWGP